MEELLIQCDFCPENLPRVVRNFRFLCMINDVLIFPFSIPTCAAIWCTRNHVELRFLIHVS